MTYLLGSQVQIEPKYRVGLRAGCVQHRLQLAQKVIQHLVFTDEDLNHTSCWYSSSSSISNSENKQARSCLKLQADAEAAVKDGLDAGLLSPVVSAGHSGKFKRNVARDLVRRALSHLELQVQVYDVDIVQPHRKTLDCKVRKAHIVLPHEMWAAIAQYPTLHSTVFGSPSSWSEFWKRCQGEAWFEEHALHDQIMAAPEMYCPYVIHGDDAPLCKRGKRSVRVIQWSSPVSQAPTLMQKLVIATNETKSPLAYQHQAAIDQAAAWSFNIALDNAFPAFDHNDEPIKGRRRYKSGQPLHAGGVKMVFAGTVGDWKWHFEAFNLQHYYSCEQCCQNCRAVKSVNSLMCAYNFALDAPWTESDRTLQEYVEEQVALDTLHPFCTIKGWHTKNIFEDALHTDCLGVRQLANGGALWELAKAGHWGPVPAGAWRESMNFVLRMAWDAFANWMAANNKRVNVTPFNCNLLDMYKQTDWPKLKSKAAAAATITEWLLPISQTAAGRDGASHHDRMRHLMLWGMDTLWQEYRNGPFPCDARCALFEKARKAALCGYNAVSKANYDIGSFIYPVIPKHHHMDHMIRRCVRTGISPGVLWTFSEEDMMKWMGSISGKAHGLGICKSPVCRWLVFWCNQADEAGHLVS